MSVQRWPSKRLTALREAIAATDTAAILALSQELADKSAPGESYDAALQLSSTSHLDAFKIVSKSIPLSDPATAQDLLGVAIREGSPELVAYIISHTPSKSADHEHRIYNAIIEASAANRPEILDIFFDAASHPSKLPGDAVNSALRIAAGLGHTEATHSLIQRGQVPAKDINPALLASLQAGHAKTARMLLAHADKPLGHSFLLEAARHDADLFKEVMACSDKLGADGALCRAASRGNIDVVGVLLPVTTSAHHDAAIPSAAASGRLDLVKMLLNAIGSPVSAFAASEALVYAARADAAPVAALFVSHKKISREARVKSARIAAQKGSRALLDLMLPPLSEEHIDPGNREIILLEAVKNGHLEATLALLAEPMFRRLAPSALQMAAKEGDEEMVAALLEVPASRSGIPAAVLDACRSDHANKSLLLLLASATPAQLKKSLPAALDVSANEGAEKNCQSLIDHGARPNVSMLHNAFHQAREDGHEIIMSAMIAAAAQDILLGCFNFACRVSHSSARRCFEALHPENHQTAAARGFRSAAEHLDEQTVIMLADLAPKKELPTAVRFMACAQLCKGLSAVLRALPLDEELKVNMAALRGSGMKAEAEAILQSHLDARALSTANIQPTTQKNDPPRQSGPGRL